MKLDYWVLFQFASVVFIILLVREWILQAPAGILQLLPAANHSPAYNLAVWVLLLAIVAGIIGHTRSGKE